MPFLLLEVLDAANRASTSASEKDRVALLS